MTARIDVSIKKRLEHFTLDAAFQSDAPVLALFGRSGSGKSTIANCIAGIARPDSGRIAIDGVTLFDSERGIALPPEQRRIGYVFQESLLFPHLSVESNLRYGMRLDESADAPASPERVIALLGLEQLLKRRPATLSGGEKQRVAIGRALLSNPRILLMDEPLASLDGDRRHEILGHIENLRDRLHIPILFISHAVPEVTRLADDMALLSEGRILAAGPVHEVMGRLDLHPHTGRHEAGAVIETTVHSHDEEYELTRLDFGSGHFTMPRIDATPGERIRVRIRAREVSLATSRPHDISMINVFEGILTELTDEPGSIIEARVRVGDIHLIARITRHSANRLQLAPGKTVYALLKAVSIDRRSVGQS